MTEIKSKKRLGWVFLVIFGVFGLLLIISYFVLTSGGFIRSVILPKAGKSLNAEIKAESISLSPFSSIELTGFTLTPQGKDQLVAAQKVRARYSLMDIIKGNIRVQEVTLESPVITLIEYPDGTKNLDPLLKKSEPASTGKPGADKKTVFDITNVQLKNGTVQQIKRHKNGTQDLVELANLNLSLDQFKTGQPSNLQLNSNLKMDQSVTNRLEGQLDGKFAFSLSPDFKPQRAGGTISATIAKAVGGFETVSGLKTELSTDMDSKEIKSLTLSFSKAGSGLGQILVSGPFNFETLDGSLNVVIAGIDRNVMQLGLGNSGLDFGSSKINSTNKIDLTSNAKKIAVDGGLFIRNFTVAKDNLTTPVSEISFAYQVSVDQAVKLARIEKFNLQASDQSNPFLLGKLSQPMAINFGSSTQTVPDSKLQINLTNFNLGAWKAFVGKDVEAGILNTDLQLSSLQNGERLLFNMVSSARDLTAAVSSNKITGARINLAASGEVQKFETVTLANLDLKAGKNRDFLSFSTSGKLNLKNQAMDLKSTAQLALQELESFILIPNTRFANGDVLLTANIRQEAAASSSNAVMLINGNLTLKNLTGMLSSNRLEQFGTSLAFDLSKGPDKIQIKSMEADLSRASAPGGRISGTGEYFPTTGAARADLKLVDLNQNGIGPFLASTFGDKQLVTVNLAGNLIAAYDPLKASDIKADFQLSKLVVKDPAKPQPDAPLAAGLKLDSSINKKQIDLRQLQLTLSPTAKAANQLDAKGSLDLTRSNALDGKLVLRSDSLDLTPFYDLSESGKSGKTTEEKKPADQTAKSGPGAGKPADNSNTEPAAMNLPVGNLALDVDVGRFYLREIAMSNLVMKARVQGSKVALSPISLSINGAPVTAGLDLNLGVPGYIYDLNLFADRIPLEPLANSFMPEDRGKYKGDLIANAQIRGLGTTGKSLQKNLEGKLQFSFTNANIQLASPRAKMLLIPIGAILKIRDITESPLNWVHAVANLGKGEIDLAQLGVESEAFRATTQGKIPIADILTNSPLNKLPVKFELRRSLAEKSNLLPANTPPEAKFVEMPSFVSVVGTLGVPKSDLNERALAGMLLKSTSGIVGGDAGKVLQGLGGILTGQPGTASKATNSVTTNVVTGVKTTNQPPSGSLNQILDLFNKPKK